MAMWRHCLLGQDDVEALGWALPCCHIHNQVGVLPGPCSILVHVCLHLGIAAAATHVEGQLRGGGGGRERKASVCQGGVCATRRGGCWWGGWALCCSRLMPARSPLSCLATPPQHPHLNHTHPHAAHLGHPLSLSLPSPAPTHTPRTQSTPWSPPPPHPHMLHAILVLVGDVGYVLPGTTVLGVLAVTCNGWGRGKSVAVGLCEGGGRGWGRGRKGAGALAGTGGRQSLQMQQTRGCAPDWFGRN